MTGGAQNIWSQASLAARRPSILERATGENGSTLALMLHSAHLEEARYGARSARSSSAAALLAALASADNRRLAAP